MNSSTGTSPRVGFTGKDKSIESRYIAMGARQYDPALGRFLSPDPLFEMSPSLNPYHYCGNSPMIFKDPTGLYDEREDYFSSGNRIYVIHTMYVDGESSPLEPGKRKIIGTYITELVLPWNDGLGGGGDNISAGGNYQPTMQGVGGVGQEHRDMPQAKNRPIFDGNFGKTNQKVSELNRVPLLEYGSDNSIENLIWEAKKTLWFSDLYGGSVMPTIAKVNYSIIVRSGADIANIYKRLGYKSDYEFIPGLSTGITETIPPYLPNKFYVFLAAEIFEDKYDFRLNYPMKNPITQEIRLVRMPLCGVLAHELWHLYKKVCSMLGLNPYLNIMGYYVGGVEWEANEAFILFDNEVNANWILENFYEHNK